MKELKAKGSDLVEVTVIPLKRDGSQDTTKQKTTKVLTAIGDDVDLTARQIWTEAGMPDPAVVEVQVISQAGRYTITDGELERID